MPPRPWTGCCKRRLACGLSGEFTPRNESLHAPELLDLEVAQVLRRLVREGSVSTNRAGQMIEDLLNLHG